MKFRQATKPAVSAVVRRGERRRKAYPKRYVEGFVEKCDFIRTSSLKGCGAIGRMLRIFREGKTAVSIAPAENTREPSNGFRNGSVYEFCNWLIRMDSEAANFARVLIVFTLLVFFAESKLCAEDRFLFDAYVKLDENAEKAIKKAQSWLAESQYQDGSWDYKGKRNTGVTAFAIMALMVNGSIPGEGPYGKEIGRGLQFLLNSQKESGLIVADPKSEAPMYQHALATVALAEMFGMTENPRIYSALINAVNLIVEVQDNTGGWRYQPVPSQGDISATVMQVMALRAAADTGIYVPNDTIARAIKFVKKCYNAKEKGFGYMNGNGPAGFARTGAGLVCIQSVGLYDDPIIPSVVNYIMEKGFDDKADFYWYGHYYSSVGMYHYGGDPWKTYYPKIKEKIYAKWEKNGHDNNVLDTAWQILILGVPFRYLPIYQR